MSAALKQKADAAPARLILAGSARGRVLALQSGLSFWGGIDPDTGRIVDAHHPAHGETVGGKILMMPTSRGSCSGSGVLLQLAMNGCAPAALVFREGESILTLGALVADRLFGYRIPVLRCPAPIYEFVAGSEEAEIAGAHLCAGGNAFGLVNADASTPDLTDHDRRLLDGEAGPAAALAMDIVSLMAVAEGARHLTDVTRAHIDGCILAHDANLIFAEKMAQMGARVAIPTTTNAISVDRENWRAQGVCRPVGKQASRLADAYTAMGARPTFTCAPYLLDGEPAPGEAIGWSESNAVIYANSVLGARTAKHADYLDLFVAMTGRAPLAAEYTPEGRRPQRIIHIDLDGANMDDAFWPLAGWLTGKLSPDRVPLVRGLEAVPAHPDDLKAFCAAFGTTSGSALLHIAGHTPEADQPVHPDADVQGIAMSDLAGIWRGFNPGPAEVDLVAIGSPHASLTECRKLADLLEGQEARIEVIVTLGRDVLKAALSQGLVDRLGAQGVRLIPDLCWCSITEPVLPEHARVIMTNSGKYAHYGTGLTGRDMRFGSLAACAKAALTGKADDRLPDWLAVPV